MQSWLGFRADSGRADLHYYNVNMPTSAGHIVRAGQKGSSRWLLPVIILAAFAIRLVVVCFTYRDLPDADKFYEQFGWEMGWIARALASGHGFSSPYYPWSGPTAIEPPLYPDPSLRCLQALRHLLAHLGIRHSLHQQPAQRPHLHPGLLQRQIFPRRARRQVAAWVWAFYPFAIYFSAGRVWEYALTGLLFTTCFCIAQRIHRTVKPLAWLGWGALYGLTALSNPAALSTLPFLLLAGALQGAQVRRALAAERRAHHGCGYRRAHPVDSAQLSRSSGVLCPVRDNIWLEIYADNFGNAPWDPSSPPSADKRPYPASNPVEMQKYLAMGETAYLAEKHAMSIDDFKHHPHYGFLVQSNTAPHSSITGRGYWSFSAEELQAQPFEPENMFYVCCMTLLMLRGIRRFWRQNRAALWPYLVLIGIFPLTYYLTNPLMDYRQAIEPAIVVLAVSGVLPWRRIRPGGANQWVGAERALEPEFASTPPAA